MRHGASGGLAVHGSSRRAYLSKPCLSLLLLHAFFISLGWSGPCSTSSYSLSTAASLNSALAACKSSPFSSGCS